MSERRIGINLSAKKDAKFDSNLEKIKKDLKSLQRAGKLKVGIGSEDAEKYLKTMEKLEKVQSKISKNKIGSSGEKSGKAEREKATKEYRRQIDILKLQKKEQLAIRNNWSKTLSHTRAYIKELKAGKDINSKKLQELALIQEKEKTSIKLKKDLNKEIKKANEKNKSINTGKSEGIKTEEDKRRLIQQQTAELGKLEKRLRNSTPISKEHVRLKANLRQEVIRLNSELKKGNTISKKGMNDLDTSIKTIRQSAVTLVSEIGSLYIKFRAISRMATSLKNELIVLDESMYNLGVVAGMSGNEITKLRRDMLLLAKDFPHTAEEIAGAAETITRTGVEFEKAMQIMDSAMKLATASGANLGQVSQALAKTLVAFSLDAAEAEHAIQSLHSVAINTPTSIEGLTQTLQNSAASFATLVAFTSKSGEELENYKRELLDTNVAIAGGMARLGMSASQQGTVIRFFFNRLLSAERSAIKLFDDMNLQAKGATLTYERFARIASQDVGEALNILSDNFDKLAQNRDVLARMFTSRHWGKISPILQDINGDIENYRRTIIGSKDVTKDFEIQMQSTGNSLGQLKQNFRTLRTLALEDFKITLDNIIPVLNTIIDSIRAFEEETGGMATNFVMVSVGMLGLGVVVRGLTLAVKALYSTMSLSNLAFMAVALTVGYFASRQRQLMKDMKNLNEEVKKQRNTFTELSQEIVRVTENINSLEKANEQLSIMDYTSEWGNVNSLIDQAITSSKELNSIFQAQRTFSTSAGSIFGMVVEGMDFDLSPLLSPSRSEELLTQGRRDVQREIDAIEGYLRRRDEAFREKVEDSNVIVGSFWKLGEKLEKIFHGLSTEEKELMKFKEFEVEISETLIKSDEERLQGLIEIEERQLRYNKLMEGLVVAGSEVQRAFSIINQEVSQDFLSFGAGQDWEKFSEIANKLQPDILEVIDTISNEYEDRFNKGLENTDKLIVANLGSFNKYKHMLVGLGDVAENSANSVRGLFEQSALDIFSDDIGLSQTQTALEVILDTSHIDEVKQKLSKMEEELDTDKRKWSENDKERYLELHRAKVTLEDAHQERLKEDAEEIRKLEELKYAHIQRLTKEFYSNVLRESSRGQELLSKEELNSEERAEFNKLLLESEESFIRQINLMSNLGEEAKKALIEVFKGAAAEGQKAEETIKLINDLIINTLETEKEQNKIISYTNLLRRETFDILNKSSKLDPWHDQTGLERLNTQLENATENVTKLKELFNETEYDKIVNAMEELEGKGERKDIVDVKGEVIATELVFEGEDAELYKKQYEQLVRQYKELKATASDLKKAREEVEKIEENIIGYNKETLKLMIKHREHLNSDSKQRQDKIARLKEELKTTEEGLLREWELRVKIQQLKEEESSGLEKSEDRLGSAMDELLMLGKDEKDRARIRIARLRDEQNRAKEQLETMNEQNSTEEDRNNIQAEIYERAVEIYNLRDSENKAIKEGNELLKDRRHEALDLVTSITSGDFSNRFNTQDIVTGIDGLRGKLTDEEGDKRKITLEEQINAVSSTINFTMTQISNISNRQYQLKVEELSHDIKMHDLESGLIRNKRDLIRHENEGIRKQKELIDLQAKQAGQQAVMQGLTGGLTQGMTAGSAFGATGAVIGGVVGAIGGLFGGNSAKREAVRRAEREKEMLEEQIRIRRLNEIQNTLLEKNNNRFNRFVDVFGKGGFERASRDVGIGGGVDRDTAHFARETDYPLWKVGLLDKKIAREDEKIEDIDEKLKSSTGFDTWSLKKERKEAVEAREALKEERRKYKDTWKTLLGEFGGLEGLDLPEEVLGYIESGDWELVRKYLLDYKQDFWEFEETIKNAEKVFKDTYFGFGVDFEEDESGKILDVERGDWELLNESINTVVNSAREYKSTIGTFAGESIIGGFLNMDAFESKELTDLMTKLERQFGNLSNGDREAVFSDINDTIKEIELVQESVNEKMRANVRLWETAGGKISDVKDFLLPDLYESMAEIFSAESYEDGIDGISDYLFNTLSDRRIEDIINEQFGEAFVNLNDDLYATMQDFSFQSAMNIRSDMQSVAIQAEGMRMQMRSLQDMLTFNQNVEYSSSDEQINYSTGSTQSVVNNYYQTVALDVGAFFGNNEDSMYELAEILAPAMEQVMAKR